MALRASGKPRAMAGADSRGSCDQSDCSSRREGDGVGAGGVRYGTGERDFRGNAPPPVKAQRKPSRWDQDEPDSSALAYGRNTGTPPARVSREDPCRRLVLGEIFIFENPGTDAALHAWGSSSTGVGAQP